MMKKHMVPITMAERKIPGVFRSAPTRRFAPLLLAFSLLGPHLTVLTAADPIYRAPTIPNRITTGEILKGSQISYRADGGFSKVQSFGVIISCVNGRISVMKSILDPRLSPEQSRLRQIGTMDTDDYVRLWDSLQRQALFRMKDAEAPKLDIADEFTTRFYARVGNYDNQFEVYGISRPEASRYYGILKKIDQSVHMEALWSTHANLARTIEAPETTSAQ